MMTPNHSTAMSFDASSFSGSDAARRKTYAIVGAGVCVVIFVMVYVFSGTKPATKKVSEPDQQLPSIDGQSVVDLDQVGGGSDWYENIPAGAVVAQNPPSEPAVKDAPTTPLSSVVIGDKPAAEPPAESVMKPGQTPGTGVVAQTQTSGGSAQVSSSPSQGTASVDAASVASQSPNSKPTASPAMPNGAVASIPPVNAPMATIGSANSPVATIPPVNAPLARIGQVNAPTAKSSPVNAPVAKVGAPAVSSAPSLSVKKGKSTASTQQPKFVRPTRKQPGIIARTSVLVTESEFRQAPKPAAPQAKPGQTSAKPVAAAKPAPPARVRQQEARTFAAQTTEQLREQGLIKPSERIRLPRSTETSNPTIWREDDAPVTPEERRPFGLVLAEENPAFTPEGIPLRTDIPAGASPLEKTGVDKPLWKRPQ